MIDWIVTTYGSCVLLLLRGDRMIDRLAGLTLAALLALPFVVACVIYIWRELKENL